MKNLFTIFFISSCSFLMAQSSVLSTGTWYKVGITETGIYKIDRNTLDILGVSADVNPRKIKIYGNGVKGILPQSNAEERPIDLVENAILVSGESDGSFDQNDHVLFYGVGPDKIEWTQEGLTYEKNIYSDTAFYFINVDGADGMRIDSQESVTGMPANTIQTFQDLLTFEEDKRNLISSGRQWFGEMITSGESRNFDYLIKGLSSDVELALSVVSQSSEDATFDVDQNGSLLGSVSLEAVPDGPGTTYSIKARQAVDTFSLSGNSNLSFEINFNGNASGERGYIDYFTLSFRRALKLYNSQTSFRWIENLGDVIRYEISDADGATIWNVTDPVNVKNQQYESAGSLIAFQSESQNIEEFVVFAGNEFPTPFVFGGVSNQDLRGNVNHDAIIVTFPEFLPAAQRLAEFHEAHDGLQVAVATTKQVYNEFSSGRQDISAIRDYAKYIYDRGGSLKYLLLLGDCSYDYKDRIANNTNYVPTYESRQSFHPIFSYSSDDYFGFLEDDEGSWEEINAGDHTLEIGVGRLPSKSIEEAMALVDKVIYYATNPKTLGKWRSEITYAADDGDANIHARHVEDLSELIDTTYAQYKINKVLLDAFAQEGTGSSEKSPQARSALKTRIKEGTFVVNFIGHGNERLWMEEEILTKADIQEMTNRDKLPIFVTATCEFGRYDDPIGVSGAEDLLLLKTGGGIALLTTSRPVFASTNFSLNQAFHQNIFREEQGQNLRLGDVIRLTKNQGLEGPVNRNFTLLGDPMMMPAYPGLQISLNNVPDTLRALEEVTLSGSVLDGGQLQSNFNGRLFATVFDVEQSFKTKGQESNPYTYSLRSNALFRGEASVVDGEFTFTFVVPKNISYQNEKGKLSLYAFDTQNNLDAGGATREFRIGGTNPNPPVDTTPPTVDLYLNDATFNNGDVVGQSPLLIATLEDENGITTTRTGVVQGITLSLNGENLNLNDFYIARPNEFRRGTVVYPLQDLTPGSYSATLKVWDTHNNASEKTIDFIVTNESVLFTYNALAYPNPVVGTTVFSFEHDREEEDLLVSLIIYSSRGEIVSKKNLLYENSDRIIEVPWEANSDQGQPLNQGVYYSKLIIRSRLDGATKEINQKLVIVN